MAIQLFLLFNACTAPDPADTALPDDTASDLCWTDLAAGDAAPLATGFDAGTEGIAFVDGRLFVSHPAGIAEVGADGVVTPVVTLDHALGLAPAVGGLLVADPGVFTFDGSGDDGRLLYVDLATASTRALATAMPNPNFVTVTPTGDTLVSDDTGELIYAASGGVVTTWLAGVPSPNGMALAPDGRTLYVATTFLPDPPLWKVPLDAGGVPGEPTALATFDTGAAPDGIAVGADGDVWVALNLASQIARVDPNGQVETFTSAVTTPASLAFGAGDGFDPCSLYVTELYGETVWRVATGGPGLAVAAAPVPPGR